MKFILFDLPLFDSLCLFVSFLGGEGTIFVTEVTDPSKYGVVVSEPNGQIKNFIEKPQGKQK